MTEKDQYKHIIQKTSKIFFIFYFLIMIIFSFIYEQINVRVDENNLRILIDDLQKHISENITQCLNNKDNLITNLNILLSEFENKDTTDSIINVALYNSDKKLISKNGNYLICYTSDNKKKYIDINEYLNDNEFAEILRAKNCTDKNRIYSFTADGYEDGDSIVPKNIKTYIQVLNDDGRFEVDKPNVLTQFKFNLEEHGHLIKNYANTDLKLLNNKIKPLLIDNRADYYKPYSECDDCFKAEFINLLADDTYYESFSGLMIRKNKIVKNFNINDTNYYITFQSEYSPFENVFKLLMPVYIMGLIFCIIFILLLSRSFYKIYTDQIKLTENRRRMTSAITHEFKTPLGIIRAYSEGIKENIAQEKRDHYLDIIINETYRMDKMVLEMLDLSKLELKLYKLKKETFCINSLVEKVINNNEKIFNDNNIVVNYGYDETYEIYADYFRIEQVIQNLVSNAVNNTNSKIEIIIKEHSVHFINDGNKINEEKFNFIWDLFYKEDDSRTSTGTGIGLAIVKSIIELHNMEVNAKNTETGVDFWFVF